MFIQYKNFLSKFDLSYLHKIAKNECENFTYISDVHSKYQSHSNMHVKYEQDKIFNSILAKILSYAKNYKPVVKIGSCWFNKTTDESNYSFHTHEKFALLSCVFYIDNCKDDGTIFRFNNLDFKYLVEDNTLLFFDPEYVHSCPPWSGKDRYTMAIQF